MVRQDLFSSVDLHKFKNDGFVVVKNLFSPDEMEVIKRNTHALMNEKPSRGRQMVYLEKSQKEPDKKQVSRIENFFPFNAALRGVCEDVRLMDRLEQLFGEPAILFKDKINYKLPGEGQSAAHQDTQSNWADYANFFISVQICVDENTVENGCLEIAPGSNQQGSIGASWAPLPEDLVCKMDFIEFTANPGDCIFFDCFVVHRSKPNLSDKSRSNFYLTYSQLSQGDHREEYFSGKRADFPPDNERKAGQDLKFKV